MVNVTLCMDKFGKNNDCMMTACGLNTQLVTNSPVTMIMHQDSGDALLSWLLKNMFDENKKKVDIFWKKPVLFFSKN